MVAPSAQVTASVRPVVQVSMMPARWPVATSGADWWPCDGGHPMSYASEIYRFWMD